MSDLSAEEYAKRETQLERCTELAVKVFGSFEAAVAWLDSPQELTFNKPPTSYIAAGEGSLLIQWLEDRLAVNLGTTNP